MCYARHGEGLLDEVSFTFGLDWVSVSLLGAHGLRCLLDAFGSHMREVLTLEKLFKSILR